MLVITAAIIALVSADVYMHNPRGSNDRLNGGGTNRDNANRLFNSQNNDKGGYAINTFTGMMSFYESSWLTVEWTQQHSCGVENTDCAIILQYMCGSSEEAPETLVRDGMSEQTITEANYADKNAENPKKLQYGMHEPLDYFRNCETRERNGGLYIADRGLGGKSAQFTRQSNGGTRYGFECGEERDYYPYWHPSPWRDIAVLVNDVKRCEWYQQQSQNVIDKGHCEPSSKMPTHQDKKDAWQYNNQTQCEKTNNIWVTDGRWNLKAPDCLRAPHSRDNHLGNAITDTIASSSAHYNWTLPSALEEPCIAAGTCRCVLRLRYNVTTGDFKGFGDRNGYGNFVDFKFNGKEKALVTQNPLTPVQGKMLHLALNTDQYARTFQDRSHVFSIRARPANLLSQRIININVRGKRGNIVQTYPAVEYDFVPTHLIARQHDFVHFQWVGFDNNPNNGGNNAEGFDGSDRSNICQISSASNNLCMCDTEACFQKAGVSPLFESPYHRELFAYVGQKDETDCDSYDTLQARHNNDQNRIDNDRRNCGKLNAADALFDAGLIKVNETGIFNYMSSRNNNFSNRSQKATITVLPILSTWAIAVVSVGGVLLISTIGVAMLVLHGKRNPGFSLNKMFERV